MLTPADPIHGELGVLLEDGERIQCHACGEWYLHLGVHTNVARGLNADAYRHRFGLMSKAKLGGPAGLVTYVSSQQPPMSSPSMLNSTGSMGGAKQNQPAG